MTIYTLLPDKSIFMNTKTGLSTRLGEHEMKLLLLLIENPGVLLTTEHLMHFAWEGKCVSRGSLSKAVCTLRMILKDSPPYKIIINKPRSGYLLNINAVSLFLKR